MPLRISDYRCEFLRTVLSMSTDSFTVPSQRVQREAVLSEHPTSQDLPISNSFLSAQVPATRLVSCNGLLLSFMVPPPMYLFDPPAASYHASILTQYYLFLWTHYGHLICLCLFRLLHERGGP